MTTIENIIEALGAHENKESIQVLEELGTNHKNDDIREMTAKALIRRNEHDSLKIIITNRGKGINDLSSKVALSAVNQLLSLDNKSETIKILNDTINLHSDPEIRDSAKAVKTLIELSA
jgi:hypothetical protein